MTTPFLTVHTLTALPWHNLNRDESGAPKQVTEGGVVRARLSSQSLKRAARMRFERAAEAHAASTRTKIATSVIVDRIEQIRGLLTPAARAKLTTAVGKRVSDLTHNPATGDAEDTRRDTLVWLSVGELETVAQAFAAGEEADVVTRTDTDSLAIAAFGRMFTHQPGLLMPAAISVGDAVTTHAATIELDWFAGVDDAETSHTGAGQLGFNMQTTGVYYRSFTIDPAQLARNYSGDLTDPAVEPALRELIAAVTLALPGGRSAGTAAQVLPAFIFAEEQAHRVAYDFHMPVQQGPDGGFLTASIDALQTKALAARAFRPSIFGDSITTGTDWLMKNALPSSGPAESFDDYVEFVLTRLRGRG